MEEGDVLKVAAKELKEKNRVLIEKVFWLCWIVVVLGVGVLTVVVMWFSNTPDDDILASLIFILVFIFVMIPIIYALIEGIVITDDMEKVF